MHFEDFEVGQKLLTGSRTVTETDVVNFAGVSGDFNRIHTDVEFAADTIYGQRIVYGLLGLSMLTGLIDRAGWFSGTAIAMLGIDGWTFDGPIFIGDTIHAELTITSLRRTRKGDRGVVGRHFAVINQRGETVQSGNINMMVRAREVAQ